MAYKVTRIEAPDTHEESANLEPPSKGYRLYDTQEARNGQLICVWATEVEFGAEQCLDDLCEQVGDLELVTKGGGDE